MPVLTSFEEINKHLKKIMEYGELCNKTYGVDVEFTNCPNTSQVINTIQIAYSCNINDVLIIFFPMDENYHSPLKDEFKQEHNALKSFLTSRNHVKVGVNIIDDVAKIERDLGIKTLNYVDIQSLAISLNINTKSMDGLGSLYIKDYIPKNKPGGGYMTLDERKINYAATDAINSYKLYYYILGTSKYHMNQSNKIELKIDDDVVKFATEFFRKIKGVNFIGFANHMGSCYSSWCKNLSKPEVIDMTSKLINTLQEKDIIKRVGEIYSINL